MMNVIKFGRISSSLRKNGNIEVERDSIEYIQPVQDTYV